MLFNLGLYIHFPSQAHQLSVLCGVKAEITLTSDRAAGNVYSCVCESTQEPVIVRRARTARRRMSSVTTRTDPDPINILNELPIVNNRPTI